MVTTTKELQKYWDSFSKHYSNNLEVITINLGRSINNMILPRQYKNILEIGCGSGILTLEILPTLEAGTKYTSLDLSDEMLKIAKERKANSHIEEVLKEKGIEHSFLQGDSENLTDIPDESVDCVISSLVLHLVENPEKMLAEVKRVLKKGGVFGFSVLGKKENAPYFHILTDRFPEFGVQIPMKRSIYYLGDREKLIEIVDKSGLESEFCWVEQYPTKITTVEGLSDLYNIPRNKQLLESLDEEKRNGIKKATEKAFEEFKKKKIPIFFEGVLIVGKKE